LNARDISDQALIAATQLTVELDKTLFPVNPKGPQKELSTWMWELQQQHIPDFILQMLRRGGDIRQVAARAKKAVACLCWITDKPLAEIEEILTKHGGRYDGIAGPVRNAASRTHDLLATVARVAEILHPDLKLDDRDTKLFVRLEVGVPSSILDLAKIIGSTFSRSDYHSLIRTGLFDMETLRTATNEQILAALTNDESKLNILRIAIEDFFRTSIADDQAMNAPVPSLPPYEP
jgi:hypothetical protein